MRRRRCGCSGGDGGGGGAVGTFRGNFLVKYQRTDAEGGWERQDDGWKRVIGNGKAALVILAVIMLSLYTYDLPTLHYNNYSNT